jgi:Response regulators consisting of a CheY-like receiver domain and a winged-helix DNA-binding domain
MTAKKLKILVADDDPQWLRLVLRSLQPEGFALLTARDGKEALALIKAEQPDLVLLDVIMPHLDGFALCQKVREFSLVPIIIITACGSDSDKIRGLQLGADDYLTKPFNMDELIARVYAVLRRVQFGALERGCVGPTHATIGDISIDYEQRRVVIREQEIILTATEYRLLAYLIRNAGHVLTQDLLLEHIWGCEYTGESHMLQVCVNRLRHKIEPDPTHPTYIQTRIGIGYSFSAKPHIFCDSIHLLDDQLL